MGYPYTDESYPTIERLEQYHEQFSTAFYGNLNRLLRERAELMNARIDAKPVNVTVNITVDGVADDENATERLRDAVRTAVEESTDTYHYLPDELPLKDMLECYGLAFAMALSDVDVFDDDDLPRLFQDFMAVLSDGAIGKYDKEQVEKYRRRAEEERKLREAEYERQLAGGDGGAGADDADGGDGSGDDGASGAA